MIVHSISFALKLASIYLLRQTFSRCFFSRLGLMQSMKHDLQRSKKARSRSFGFIISYVGFTRYEYISRTAMWEVERCVTYWGKGLQNAETWGLTFAGNIMASCSNVCAMVPILRLHGRAIPKPASLQRQKGEKNPPFCSTLYSLTSYRSQRVVHCHTKLFQDHTLLIAQFVVPNDFGNNGKTLQSSRPNPL